MAGQRIGYVRVSTFEQNFQRQLEEDFSTAFFKCLYCNRLLKMTIASKAHEATHIIR